MVEELTAADFAALTGDALAVRVLLGDEVLEVPFAVAAVEVGETPAPGFREPFAVALRGPGEPSLPQGVYEVVHPTHGVLELLVVPHGPRAGGGLDYSITFG